jgi:hypothetical protein
VCVCVCVCECEPLSEQSFWRQSIKNNSGGHKMETGTGDDDC